jgi:signal transduction histidine kinase
MEQPRWWHVAVTAMSIVLTAMVVATELPGTGLLVALGAIAVILGGWFAIGRLAFHTGWASVAYRTMLILAVGVMVGAHPVLAIAQTLAYPLLWVLARGLREAVVTNVLLAMAVAAGFWVSTGDLVQTVITVGLSLAFSLAFGLWISQIAGRSEERQRLLDELRATQDRLAAAARDAGIAGERERLAREIHDTIAQDLTGLVLLTQRARREHAAGAPEAGTLELLEQSARGALTETRALVAASAPVGLDAAGIVEALRRLADRFERETGVTVAVQADELPALGRDTEVVLLRCAQEGLANVRKHAAATTASIAVVVEGGTVRLRVHDDGRGFEPDTAPSGFGLDGMRDRLALVGGSLDVTSSSRGTVLSAVLPVGAPA